MGRTAAFRDLTDRVNNKRECWAWQIQNMVFMISMEGNYGRTTLEEVLNEVWRRGIKLPSEVRDDMIKKMKYDNTTLSNTLVNVPVLGKDTFNANENEYHMKRRIMR